MDALYLAIQTTGPDPIRDHITHLSARLRYDDLTYTDLDERLEGENATEVLSRLSVLIRECDVLIGYNLQVQVDFLNAHCARPPSWVAANNDNYNLFLQLWRCKKLCIRTLATQCHASEGSSSGTTLYDLLEEFTGILMSVAPDAREQVTATEIVHQAIFCRLQESPDFMRVGRDLVRFSVN